MFLVANDGLLLEGILLGWPFGITTTFGRRLVFVQPRRVVSRCFWKLR